MSIWERMGGADGDGALPPGQWEREDWPVLHEGEIPDLPFERWTLKVGGLVEREMEWDAEALGNLPLRTVTADLHCVETWTHRGIEWRGIPLVEFLALAGPLGDASHVVFHCEGGYSTCVPLEDALRDTSLLALELSGRPLPRERGGPLRVVLPHLYGWKSAKWVRRVELSSRDRPGYWEQRGYHARGDASAEERYGEEE